MDTIQTWLSQGGRDRTAVFIAHRLSTIADCDVIFVLDEGKVVESGSHKELLDLNGVYSRLWKTQSRS
jgi:ABC-type multidrug transport system fused ATPase/permease subunit